MYTLQIDNFKFTNDISSIFKLLHSDFPNVTLHSLDNVCREYSVIQNKKEIGTIKANTKTSR